MIRIVLIKYWFNARMSIWKTISTEENSENSENIENSEAMENMRIPLSIDSECSTQCHTLYASVYVMSCCVIQHISLGIWLEWWDIGQECTRGRFEVAILKKTFNVMDPSSTIIKK